MQTIKGIAASRGIAIGPAFHFKRVSLEFQRCTVDDVGAEWARFESALSVAHRQLEAILEQASREHGAENAAIFEAQAMMLDDPELLGAVRAAVETDHSNAEAALSQAA